MNQIRLALRSHPAGLGRCQPVLRRDRHLYLQHRFRFGRCGCHHPLECRTQHPRRCRRRVLKNRLTSDSAGRHVQHRRQRRHRLDERRQRTAQGHPPRPAPDPPGPRHRRRICDLAFYNLPSHR